MTRWAVSRLELDLLCAELGDAIVRFETNYDAKVRKLEIVRDTNFMTGKEELRVRVGVEP